jgi:GNAT superfamily N-acetyltransferase
MIRLATNGDVPEIVRLGSLSLKGGPYEDFISDKPEHTMKLALQIIHGGGKVLIYEDDDDRDEEGKPKVKGLLGMLIVPHPFTGEITASEIIWFVEEEARKGGAGIKLLWEAEKVAKEMGAKKMQVSGPTQEIGAIYKRYGYEQIEVVFLKEL